MDTPQWFTADYMEKALRVYYNDASLKIINIEVSPALEKGENYGGVLTKIKVQYDYKNGAERRSTQYIMKTSFESDDFANEKMGPYDIYNREISIYEGVLPKLQHLLRQINDSDQLFAEAVHVDSKRQVLIFEDLTERGFVMADRIKRLDKQHSELILRKLAKMHAASAVLNERNEGYLESYDRGFFNRHTNAYSSFFEGNLLACARMLTKWPQYEYYSKKLRKLKHNYMDIGIKCFAPTPGEVNVLCHGDLWTNNVMFKYDAEFGVPVDTILIDFQYSFWGSPTLDLHHFFHTSLQEHIRQEELDVLQEFYHNIFSKTLCKLNYQSNRVPSLHKFSMDVEKKSFFAFHSSCIIQPVMLNENTEDADFNALMSEDERGLRFKNTIYQNKKVQENIRHLLPIFDRKGLLDVNQCD